MTQQEAAALLGWRSEVVTDAIEKGVKLPRSGNVEKLVAQRTPDGYDIAEGDLDRFVGLFEQEEPGRHPPVAVCRELRTEARHRCAVCRASAPLKYHHVLEFARLKHHDPEHMLAVCGTCHDMIHAGDIDVQDQYHYKASCRALCSQAQTAPRAPQLFPKGGPLRFAWDDLKTVVLGLHAGLEECGRAPERPDLSVADMERKNSANEMTAEYFEHMKAHHEPHFAAFERFLRSPANAEIAVLYQEVVEELRQKLALKRAEFAGLADVLVQLCDDAVDNDPAAFRGKRALLSAFMSFMYFQCDIGRKP